MENGELKNKIILDLVKILIAVDIGIVVFCYLEDNQIWFYNTQLAFFSTFFIILGAFIGYRNSIISQLENGNVGEDILKKYEDPYKMDDEEEIKKINFKQKNLKWYEAIMFSFKGGMNFIRLLGYVLLIGSFIWLIKRDIFDLISFIFGISIVPAISLLYLIILKRKFN